MNKCNFAEFSIFKVKKKLFMLLRSELSRKWVENLPIVVESFNSTPLKNLGYLRPNDIQSELDSVLVDMKKSEQNISTFKEPTFSEQIKNQENYQKDNSKLQAGDYVYLNFNEKLFDKSFDVQVSIYIFSAFFT